MREKIKKPGYMFRAVVAWFIFNGVLLATLAAVVFILGGWNSSMELMSQWFIMIPLLVAVVVSEWIIMLETIAPVISEWINQEMYVDEPTSKAKMKVVK